MEFIFVDTIIKDNKNIEYKVIEEIASEGFGQVFKIERTSDSKLYALKSLLPNKMSSKEHFESFKREGSLSVDLSHKNLINYVYFHDGSEFDFPPYIIMDYIENGDLKKLIIQQKEKEEFFSNDCLLTYFSQLISGMEELNKLIIHRDLKPANILCSDQNLIIADFGISRLVEDNTKSLTLKGWGSLAYMSPEAYNLDKNTILMDIYSMGIIFYELSTLKHPFEDLGLISQDDWKDAHLYHTPDLVDTLNSGVDSKLSYIIQKMLDKTPTDRFNSWSDIKEHLSKVELPKTDNSDLFSSIVSKRSEILNEKRTVQLAKEKEIKENNEKSKLVSFMFKNKLISQIKTFIDELNQNIAPELEVKCFLTEDKFRIQFKNNNWINIHYKVIYDKDFYKDRSFRGNLSGNWIEKFELELPRLRSVGIKAWGIIESSSGTGFNLLLCDKENDKFGEWILLTNINGAFSGVQNTVSSFYFDYSNLEKELHYINAMHIYDMKDEEFNLSKLKDLISLEINSD
jgi:serine/threonine protein kinase